MTEPNRACRNRTGNRRHRTVGTEPSEGLRSTVCMDSCAQHVAYKMATEGLRHLRTGGPAGRWEGPPYPPALTNSLKINQQLMLKIQAIRSSLKAFECSLKQKIQSNLNAVSSNVKAI